MQVYAVSGTSPTSAGSLHVLHGSEVVDTLFQSGPDYEGVTGLWSIPLRPAEVCSAFIIISFASGSRAMTAGTRMMMYNFTLKHHLVVNQLLLKCMCCCIHNFLAHQQFARHRPPPKDAAQDFVWSAAGSTLSDITEAVGLDANAQTLAAGSVADLAAVQAGNLCHALPCSSKAMWLMKLPFLRKKKEKILARLLEG